MTCEEEVLASKNPMQAILALARALDRLVADRAAGDDGGWGEWPAAMVEAVAVEHAAEIIQHGDTATVELPSVSLERYHARWSFAKSTLKLDEALGDGEDWFDAYATGGPMWLYLGNRDLVMSYPVETRRAMIEDVELDSPQDAADMARDILKVPTQDVPKVTLNDVS